MRDDEAYIPTTETVREDYAGSAYGIAFRVREREFDRWLEQIKNEAKAEAMESLLEYGYPYHPSAHSPLLNSLDGANIADDWWREEFALRARAYRGEQEYR